MFVCLVDICIVVLALMGIFVRSVELRARVINYVRGLLIKRIWIGMIGLRGVWGWGLDGLIVDLKFY